MRIVETIYRDGAFWPLEPLEIAENQKVTIQFEESACVSDAVQQHSKLVPSEVPVESLDGSIAEYQTPPLESMGKIQARFVFVGKLMPPSYPED